MSSMASLFMATYLPEPVRKPAKIRELDDLLEPIGSVQSHNGHRYPELTEALS
jgi:hypothetical protein